ncbi:TAXI family TRAP transporter solute-binding subunit [Ancylobacter mangrovi]|uniref:TAXI family TRAP transporter solute-binding subunit n=1 Tax=Ancylobacter mangrovi TaxID=2972472 RepID=A0A9X2PDT5_9HYPH|nr:TAXI family TRAP transporter solute-binding subunit [Ancylobacter mangrovi]MCS0495544.1 TAXI family TRAP transporter solute-binding subunit [Ancylobacter mangrovi]MCS0503192.1 TAXI family TRAP transporter solute-binding subunit [Ancylobacter mangrovi]
MNRLSVFCMSLAFAATTALSAAVADEPVKLRFGTVGVGSAWYNYGAGIADLVGPKLPKGSTIDVLPIAGGVGNIKLIQNGEAELGISFAVTSAEACGGFGTFPEKQDKVMGLIGGLDTYYFGTFVTKSSGVTSWQDIVDGKNKFHLLTTKAGGTGEQAVRQVLSLMGSSKDDVAAKGGMIEPSTRSGTAEIIKDGQADGWAHVVTKGHPAATQITTVNDMIMIPLPDDVIKGMVEKYGWSAVTVPPNTFKGQTEPVKTVRAASNILIAKSVPDDVAYTFAKMLVENAAALPKIHAALSDFDPKMAADPALNGNCPIHPGAAKYYREAGLMK